MSTILIADDNPADIELLLLALSECDIQATCHTVNDGQEALTLLQRVRSDLVMLDVRMPKVGGLEVLQRMRGRSDLAGVPVIIMSSSKAAQDIGHALALGALRYWQKGTLFADVLALVRTLPQLVPLLGQGHPAVASLPPAVSSA